MLSTNLASSVEMWTEAVPLQHNPALGSHLMHCDEFTESGKACAS